MRPAILPDVAAADVVVDADAAAQRLAGAVRFKTISYEDGQLADATELRGLAAYLEQHFPQVFQRIAHETDNGHALLFQWQGSDPQLPPLLLAAHQDVVPVEAGTESIWTHPAFSGDIADGFVWGRGTLDDKSSVLGILEAAEALLQKNVQPRRTVYFAFGYDEELTGEKGAAQIATLLASRGVHLGCVLDEGLTIVDGFIPGLSRPLALIGSAEKGYATFDLSAEGTGGHSSVPTTDNALAAVARAVARISSSSMSPRLVPPVRGMLDGIAPNSREPLRSVLANLWLTQSLVVKALASRPSTGAMVQTVITPTVFRSGDKDNVVPERALAAVNARLLPGDTIESVQAWLTRTIDDPEVHVRVRPGAIDASPVSATHGETYVRIAATVHAVFPDVAIAPDLMIGQTDSRHYLPIAAQTYRFLPMRLRPDDVERIHGSNERIAIGNYVEIIRFYATLMSQ